jgi:cardiolipin synthase A/B
MLTKKILISALSLIATFFAGALYFQFSTCTRDPAAISNKKTIENFIHIEHLRITDFKADHFFLISNTESSSQLVITNEIPDQNINLNLELTCDQNFQFGQPTPSSKISDRDLSGLEKKNSINKYRFQLKNQKGALFLLNTFTKNCTLIYQNDVDQNQTSNMKIIAEAQAFPFLKNLVTFQDNCSTATSNSFFEKQNLNQLSCAHALDQFQTLETPESGFIAKTEMLLGYKLSSEFIQNQNPYAELDFSKAPKLKAIYLASLVYRADFYGNVMARLLKFHAERGTLVHLVTTGYMMLDKDKKLLRNLASSNGNFRLQEFKYFDPQAFSLNPLRYVDNKYRDMHIKLLITLAEDEKNNSVVFGGRNIHDGFLFKTKPDYSKQPELVQYGTEDDYVHWNDFEMKITSKTVAENTAAHLLKFLNRDTTTETVIPFTASEKNAAITQNSENQIRHIISLPYNDQNALEKLYVSLIDSAESKIQISSPYLRPTDQILAALQRAAERHIDITIQTRVSLQGDTQAWLYEEVNKESINKLYQVAKIYEWKENSILHSKFILVDGKLAFIGSVNLSRRSFVQDVENGYLIQSPDAVAKMDVIFKSYLEKSKQITQAESRKFFPSLLIGIFKDQF